MKPRLILLTLATVLLLSCSTDETIKNQLIIEAMKTETKNRYKSYRGLYSNERRQI